MAPSRIKLFLTKSLQSALPCSHALLVPEQLFPVKVTKDFSYRANRIAGDGWVLVGRCLRISGSRLFLWVISGT